MRSIVIILFVTLALYEFSYAFTINLENKQISAEDQDEANKKRDMTEAPRSYIGDYGKYVKDDFNEFRADMAKEAAKPFDPSRNGEYWNANYNKTTNTTHVSCKESGIAHAYPDSNPKSSMVHWVTHRREMGFAHDITIDSALRKACRGVTR